MTDNTVALEDLYTGRYTDQRSRNVSAYLAAVHREQYKNALRYMGFEGQGWEDDEELFDLWELQLNPDATQIEKFAFGRALDKRSGLGASGSSGPTTAQRAAQIEAEIRNIAGQFGVQGDWAQLAATAASNNWNAAMIRDHLADMLNQEMINREGIVSSTASRVRQLAAQYYVNVSDSEVFDFAKRLASEDIDENTIATQIKARAKAKFSTLTDVIDSGETIRDYFRPHRELVAQLMDLSPDQVDLMNDARWLPILENSSGQERRPMNLYETGQYVRSLGDWQESSSARSLASDASMSIAKIMGAMG